MEKLPTVPLKEMIMEWGFYENADRNEPFNGTIEVVDNGVVITNENGMEVEELYTKYC